MTTELAPNWTEIQRLLAEPFDIEDVEAKPQTKGDNALAVLYAATRAYYDRLDAAVGAENWSMSFHLISPEPVAMICRVTIHGITKESTGEYIRPRDGEDNIYTTVEAQAFKRACTAFGLGRYLYTLPKVFAPYDSQKRQFKDPKGVVRRIYQAGGLLNSPAETKKAPQAEQPQQVAPPPPRAAEAPPKVEREGDSLRAEIAELHKQETNLLMTLYNNNGKAIYEEKKDQRVEEGYVKATGTPVQRLEAIRDAVEKRITALHGALEAESEEPRNDLDDIPF